MRSIPAIVSTIQNLDAHRPVGKIVVRDVLLRFASYGDISNPFSFTDTPTHSGNDFIPVDHCSFNGVFHSVAGYNNQLHYRKVTAPGTVGQWNSWAQISGAGCLSGSRPAVIAGWWGITAFTVESGVIKRYESADGSSWAVADQAPTAAWPPAGYETVAAVAAVGRYRCFVCGIDSTGPVCRLSVWMANLETGAFQQWSNTVFDSAYTIRAMTHFDAVQMDEDRYVILYQEVDRGLTMACIYADGLWSAPQPVIPMDLVDTTSYFRVYSVELIQGMLWAVGRVTRPGSVTGYDVSFDAIARSRDGVIWSFDRFSFASAAELRGKLLLDSSGGYVYYPGLDTLYRAPSTWLIDPASDPAAAKTTLSGDESLLGLDYSSGTAEGGASQFAAQVIYDNANSEGISQSHSVVKAGSLAWLYLGFDAVNYVKQVWPATPSSAWTWNDGSHWPEAGSGGDVHTLVDVTSIDQVPDANSIEEREISISGRGFVGKALGAAAMQDYQFLPQMRWTDDFDKLDHIIRVSGVMAAASGILTFSDAVASTLGWFSGPEGISSGVKWPLVQLQFRMNTSTSGKSCGIVVNGKDKDNYWYAKVNGSTNQIALIERAAGSETVITSTAFTPASGTWYWLKVIYRGGRFLVYTRTDGALTWTLQIDYTHAASNLPAFGRVEGLVGCLASMAADTVDFRNLFVWNEESDNSTDSLIREVCGSGGVLDVSRDLSIDQASVSLPWWSASQHANFDLTFVMPGAQAQGFVDASVFIAFRSTTNSWSSSNGYAIRLHQKSSGDYEIVLVRRDGTAYDESTDDLERVIVPWSPLGQSAIEVRLVVHKSWFSVYLNGYPAGNFYHTAVTAAGYLGFHSDVAYAALRQVAVPLLSEWREAIIVDMAGSLWSGLGRIVDGRLIKMFGSGLALRYSRFTTRANLGTLTDVIVGSSLSPNDSDRLSLVRAVGVEVIESLDSTLARDYGLLFGQVSNPSAEVPADLLAVGQRSILDSKEYAEQISVDCFPVLEAQPEDYALINYTSPDGQYVINANYVLNEVSFSFGAAKLVTSFSGRRKYA